MVVKVKDAKTTRGDKASVAHTTTPKKARLYKASVAHTTTPKKARLYLCSLQLLLQLEKSESRERSREKLLLATKEIYSMLVTTEKTGKKKHAKNERDDWRTVEELLINPLSLTTGPVTRCIRYSCCTIAALCDLQSFCSKNTRYCRCRLLENKQTFFGVVGTSFFTLIPARMRYACFVSLCFRVFHLDNHGSWEHHRRFCLCSIPLVDLSA